MAYAATTDVSVGRTKGEIDNLLRKYRATGFGVFEEQKRAILVFEMVGRRIVFTLPLPDRDDTAFTHYMRGSTRYARTATAAQEQWEQACRSRWRALLLCIKAKLESIDSKIETFEDAFLAHIQTPDGQRFGDVAKRAIAIAYQSGNLPPLLTGPSA